MQERERGHQVLMFSMTHDNAMHDIIKLAYEATSSILDILPKEQTHFVSGVGTFLVELKEGKDLDSGMKKAMTDMLQENMKPQFSGREWPRVLRGKRKELVEKGALHLLLFPSQTSSPEGTRGINRREDERESGVMDSNGSCGREEGAFPVLEIVEGQLKKRRKGEKWERNEGSECIRAIHSIYRDSDRNLLAPDSAHRVSQKNSSSAGVLPAEDDTLIGDDAGRTRCSNQEQGHTKPISGWHFDSQSGGDIQEKRPAPDSRIKEPASCSEQLAASEDSGGGVQGKARGLIMRRNRSSTRGRGLVSEWRDEGGQSRCSEAEESVLDCSSCRCRLGCLVPFQGQRSTGEQREGEQRGGDGGSKMKELELCGFVHFRFVEEEGEPVLYVYELQLGPDARGKGLGSVLLQLLFTHSSKMGMKGVMLTVQRSNTRALHFYQQRHGFSVAPHSPSEASYYILEKKLA